MALRRAPRSVFRGRMLPGRGNLAANLLRRGRLQSVRPGVGLILRGRRGGFFGSVFKGIKKVVSVVAKAPVISTIAKTALSSIPVVGSVVTAVTAAKRLAPVSSAVHLPHISASPGTDAAAVLPNYGGTKEGISQGYIKPRRKSRKRRSKSSTRTRARSGSRSRPRRSSARGTAKQRAARARFARAARKGRIKKGTRLK